MLICLQTDSFCYTKADINMEVKTMVTTKEIIDKSLLELSKDSFIKEAGEYMEKAYKGGYIKNEQQLFDVAYLLDEIYKILKSDPHVYDRRNYTNSKRI